MADKQYFRHSNRPKLQHQPQNEFGSCHMRSSQYLLNFTSILDS